MDFEIDIPDFALRINLPKLADTVGSIAKKAVQKRIIAGKYEDGSSAPQPTSYKTPPLNHTGKLVRDIKSKPSKSGASVTVGPNTKRSRKVAAILRSKNKVGVVGLEQERAQIEREVEAEIERQIASGEIDIIGSTTP